MYEVMLSRIVVYSSPTTYIFILVHFIAHSFHIQPQFLKWNFETYIIIFGHGLKLL